MTGNDLNATELNMIAHYYWLLGLAIRAANPSTHKIHPLKAHLLSPFKIRSQFC